MLSPLVLPDVGPVIFLRGAFSIACHFHHELDLSHAPGNDSSDDEEEGGEEAAVRAPFKKKKNLSSTSFF